MSAHTCGERPRSVVTIRKPNMNQEALMEWCIPHNRPFDVCTELRIQAKEEPGALMSAHIDIVFDGPPGETSGRFVEVEDEDGKSISIGEWIKRDDGYWVLRIPREAEA